MPTVNVISIAYSAIRAITVIFRDLVRVGKRLLFGLSAKRYAYRKKSSTLRPRLKTRDIRLRMQKYDSSLAVGLHGLRVRLTQLTYGNFSQNQVNL